MLAVFEGEVEIVMRVGYNRFLGENTRTICILYLYVDSLWKFAKLDIICNLCLLCVCAEFTQKVYIKENIQLSTEYQTVLGMCLLLLEREGAPFSKDI